MDNVASISDRVGDLGGYLREQREHARLSLRQLAQLAGVSNPYLSQVERGLRNPSAEVLQQIARGLQISAEALYVRAGILDSVQQRPDVEAAVQADPDLSDRQKRVLLDIYSAFLTENARAAAEAEPAEPATPRRKATKRATSARATGNGSKPRTGRAAKAGTQTGSVRRRSAARSTATAGTVSAPEDGTANGTADGAAPADVAGAVTADVASPATGPAKAAKAATGAKRRVPTRRTRSTAATTDRVPAKDAATMTTENDD